MPKKKLLVFLSHASEDKPIVRELCRKLSTDGFFPWLDEERLLPGQDWHLEIEQALRKSDVILLCFSEKSVSKEGFIQNEYKKAMDYQKEKPTGTIFVIPVRLDKCGIPFFLQELQCVDYPSGYEKLMMSLNVRTSKTVPTSNFIKQPTIRPNTISFEGSKADYKQVQLVLEGDFKEFNETRQEDLRLVLASLLRIDSENIRILQVHSGSIVVDLEMPEIAINRLRELATKRDRRLNAKGIVSIQVTGEQIITLSSAKQALRTGSKPADEPLMGLGKGSNMKEQNEFGQNLTNQKQVVLAIVAIGGGNAEYLYRSDNTVTLGQKNPIAEVRELVGGGGVNFSARLLATCHDVYPILSVGDDRTGRMIQNQLAAIAQKACVSDTVVKFINSQNFFVPDMKSSSSTVLVQPTSRTIFSYNTEGDNNVFNNFLQKRMRDVENIVGKKPDAIRVSHIRHFSKSQNLQAEGESIKRIIREYKNKSLIFVNLGASQLTLGLDYWEEALKGVDIVQLNLHEAKHLFSKDENPKTLSYIIKWFRDRSISAVITLAKFGAVGNFKNGREGVIFAWPLDVKNFVDPTGAGDALSAGMVSALYRDKDINFSDYYSAIDKGRYWASYACTTYGGCGDCPSIEDLEKMSIELRQDIEKEHGHHEPIEVVRHEHLENILRLIDKAYT